MDLILTVGITAFLGAMSPGLNMLMVTRQALISSTQGFRAALGVGLALLLHVSFTCTILALVRELSSTVLILLQLAGVSYLFFLILSLFFSLLQRKAPLSAETKPVRSAFWSTFIAALLNPGALLFYFAFFSLLFAQSHSSILEIFLALEVWFLSSSWYFLLALLLAKSSFLQNLRKRKRIIDFLLLCALVYFALHLSAMEL